MPDDSAAFRISNWQRADDAAKAQPVPVPVPVIAPAPEEASIEILDTPKDPPAEDQP